jgi:hypothetical protein
MTTHDVLAIQSMGLTKNRKGTSTVAKQYFNLDEIVFAEKPKNPRFIDIEGQVFGRLTVLGFASRLPRTHWYCSCDCGKVISVGGADLKNGKTKSCECKKSENSKVAATKHGMRFSDEYKIYIQMKDRCTNPKTKCYSRYGGGGVKLLLTFEEFYQEIGPRPSKNYSVDRIAGGSSPYAKGNIRWATILEQNNNRSNNHRLSFDGQTKTIAEWARDTSLPYSLLKKRIHRGWCEYHIFTVPPNSRKDKNCLRCNTCLSQNRS